MSASLAWPIEGAASDFVGPALNVDSIGAYRWIVVLGGILAFAMAWGIGANDVANAFATSVGSGALTLKWACVIAAFCEMGGAVLLGANVTDTVRKKIIDPDVFDPARGGNANGPELLMTAFLCALIAATTWLIIATYMELPVSTTHSIIGALIGTALVFRGPSAVIWISSGSGLNKLKGVVGVVLSWFISPVLSAIFAVSLFFIVRTTVMRTKDPVRNGYIFLPFFYAFTVMVACFFIIYKGSPRLGLSKKLNALQAAGISVGAGAVVGILSYFIVLPLAKKWIAKWEATELEKEKNPEAFAEKEAKAAKVDGALSKVGINLQMDKDLDDEVLQMHDNTEKFDPKAEKLFTWLQIFTSAFDSFAHGANDVANAVAPFASIYQLYKNNGEITVPQAGEFDDDLTLSGGALDGVEASGDVAELTGDENVNAAFDVDGDTFCGTSGGDDYFTCGAEGSVNQLVFPNTELSGEAPEEFPFYNADGELDGTIDCYKSCAPGNSTSYASDKKSVELWILALGGAGIVLGLAMWGYRIISAIGQKLTKLTPSRGFCIEVGAAITVILASRIGLPVSTTHCQVGATMGVGLAEFKTNTVNFKQFAFICFGWVFTVIFTGLLSASIFALLTNTPSTYNNENALNFCPGERLFTFDEGLQQFRGIGCSGRS